MSQKRVGIASTKKGNETDAVFLIDEPGASLHAKAQEDVLRVLEDIKDDVQIIYTSHSPYLLSLDKLYRILAVQRVTERDEKSDTIILETHNLASAAPDTLTPIYTHMGIALYHQQVIKAKNNVILEEISAYYYLSSFSKLANFQKEKSFLPVKGVTQVPKLAYLLLGWGLDFISIVDDDPSGRKIYKELKRNLYGDDEKKASKKCIKIKDCHGIEDLFSKNDFKKYILESKVSEKIDSNAQYLKKRNLSKPILALNFKRKVDEGNIAFTDFSIETQKKIKRLLDSLDNSLE